jgi:hypothetical protein
MSCNEVLTKTITLSSFLFTAQHREWALRAEPSFEPYYWTVQ